MAELVLDPETNEERVVCGYPLGSTGKVCMSAPSPQYNTGYCMQHSEREIKALAKANPRGGYRRHIGKLPPRLLDLNQDDDLYGLEAEIRLVDARIGDLLEKLPEASLLDSLNEISTQLAAIQTALDDIDSGDLGIGKAVLLQTFRDLQGTIGSLTDDRRIWNDIVKFADSRRKLVESERARVLEAQQIITQRQATSMLTHILEIIHRHVTDRTAKASIAADIEKLARSGTVNKSLI